MTPTFTLDTREFNRAIQELTRDSRRTDTEILISATRTLLRKLAWITPIAPRTNIRNFMGRYKVRRTKLWGRARAGWWPAWKGLGMRGTPYASNALLRGSDEGGIIDRSRLRDQGFITIWNMVPYIEVLDAMNNILGAAFAGAMQNVMRQVEGAYRRNLRRLSG